MPAFHDSFTARTGALGNGWIAASGELVIVTEGQAEFAFGGEPKYIGRTQAEPTDGTGWRDDTSFPHAAWKGASVHSDTLTYSYVVEHNSTRFETEPDTGTEFSSGVFVTANAGSTNGCHVEWEMDGVRYGRRTTVGSGFQVQMLGSDLPASTSERFLVLLDTSMTPTEIDRFTFPETPYAVHSYFDGTGFAGVSRKFKADPTGLWEAEVVGKCEGAQYENWGTMVLMLASDQPSDIGATSFIYLSFDVGGYLGVWYINGLGQHVLQGSVNTNSVEDNTFASGPEFSYPDERPDLTWSYKLTVDPTTGVVTVTVNGVSRGTCTIPAAEIERIKGLYDSGAARYCGFGLNPFIFGEVKDTFVFLDFKTTVPNPPGTIANAGRGANFVAPIF